MLLSPDALLCYPYGGGVIHIAVYVIASQHDQAVEALGDLARESAANKDGPETLNRLARVLAGPQSHAPGSVKPVGFFIFFLSFT